MDYVVHFTDRLPQGHDFVLLQSGNRTWAVFRRDAVTPATLEDAWAAYRAMELEPLLAAV